ncbi:hypothetical protein [Cupriavidus sp. TMH.W2]|uniref:hypothetical protein n=1 Tax=Cupriavidus sp. TMH.W2 TaxID=3434465 RepID=UPI003D777689
MKTTFVASALLACAIAPTVAFADGDQLAEMKAAIKGTDRICIAEARKGSRARVDCELRNGKDVSRRNFTVPLSWVKENFEASPGSPGKWISMARSTDPVFSSKKEAKEWLEKKETARLEAAGMLLLVHDPIPQKDGTVAVMVEAPPAGATCKVVLQKRVAADKSGPAWVNASPVPDCDFHTKQ